MREFKRGWLKSSVVSYLRIQALRGFNSGQGQSFGYVMSCMAAYPQDELRHIVQFTRDVGMHSCGWWKNPQYERCWQLSISFQNERGEHEAQQHQLAAEWVQLFYGESQRLVWVEPPYYDAGKIADVYHYRVFCDENWQPILPKGEVYSTDWTPAGWMSYSELQAYLAKRGADETQGA